MKSIVGRLCAVAVVLSSLYGCAPLMLGTAVGGAFVVTDRRTSGAQLEDQGIEIKAGNRIKEAVGERGHINVTSYNRVILLTGETVSEADRLTIEQVAARTENVRSVVNELAVMGSSSLTSRSTCWCRPRSRPRSWMRATCSPTPSRWWSNAARSS